MTVSFSINKFCSVALCVVIAISVSNGWAQIMQQDDKPDPPPKNVALAYPIGELEAMTLDQLNGELDKLVPRFRETLKAMWIARARYEHAVKAESYGYGKNWRENAIEGQEIYQKIKELAMEIYLKTDKPTEEQFELALRAVSSSASEGRIGIANRVLKKMLKSHPDDEEVWVLAGRVAVFTDDFEIADRLVQEKPKFIEELPKEHIVLFATLPTSAERWAKEKVIRQAEAKADDLPRVELTTSKGKIVIELFENEAPHTVGNFIHLVESGYYEQTFFYPVLRNFRAQTGLYFKDKLPRATDYQIVDESTAENARQVFRGSIATLPSGNTAGAGQFSMYTANYPFASGETVFGRVISGMDVADVLKVNSRFNKDTGISEQVKSREGDMPDDQIVSAKVLRKRPNVDYQPKKLPTSKK